MKFIASRDCQIVTEALNFSTADKHVIGSADLYTTKAAGGDKKLYKSIETSLEVQHENLVRLSASLSPEQKAVDSVGRNSSKSSPRSWRVPEIDLSRPSPFGTLHDISARRTFAYLIATLNATHEDYDFSNMLRPQDFRRTSGTRIRQTVDQTLIPMRPRRMLTVPTKHGYSTSIPAYPAGEIMWGEQTWASIDNEMDLRRCEKYIWEPEIDPFEDMVSILHHHYFFFNKERKRVLYLHFAAYNILSHSPINMPREPSPPPSLDGDGAGKRAQYWLGHNLEDGDDFNDHDDEDDYVEGEYRPDIDDIREQVGAGIYSYMDDVDDDDDDDYDNGDGKASVA